MHQWTHITSGMYLISTLAVYSTSQKYHKVWRMRRFLHTGQT